MSPSLEGPSRKAVGTIRHISHPLFSRRNGPVLLSFTLLYVQSNSSEGAGGMDTCITGFWFAGQTEFQPCFSTKVSKGSANH